ncbi:hypothetical protein [Simkania sp.]|uniref:hypothetical protein n=1 Tax=Simkania sp. TaxID=34094 RepID=UPI003B522778
MSTIQNTKLLTLPTNYMMNAYGSESQMTTRSLTLLATLAGTYFSFKYLLPGIDKWAGGIILVTGAAIFIFGSLSKVFEFIGEFFRHMPPPRPESYPPPTWERRRTSPYYIPPPKTPTYYPPRSNPPRSFHDSPYVPPSRSHHHHVPVVTGDGKPATITTTTHTSGHRPYRKSASEERKHHHLPTGGSKSCDLSRSWHFGGSSNPLGSGSTQREFPTPISGGSLHVGSRTGGTRPERKKLYD